MAENGNCEYEALQSMLPRLKSCINPSDLTTKCYSRRIIGQDEFEEVEDTGPRPKKAGILLRAVGQSIQKDPAVFKTFLDVLGSEATNRKLVEELGT